MDASDIKRLLEQQGVEWRRFGERQTTLEQTVEQLGAAFQRLNLGGFPGARKADTKAVAEALRTFMRGDDRELKAMSVGSDPGGGYLVIPQLSESVTRVEIDLSPVRQHARIVTIESDAFEEPLDKDAASAAWVGETTARAVTNTPQIGKLRIPVHEIYAMPEATQALIDDANWDVLAWLSEKVGTQFAVTEGAAFLSGSGIGRPRGLLTYPTSATADATRNWGEFEHVVTGTSGGFGADPNGANKLIDLVHKLKAGYRRNAVWLMNKKTAGEVRKLKDTAGRFVWVDSLQAGMPSSLLDMPDIAANSLSIAFGNLRRGYIVVDRYGVRLLVDPFTNKPYVRLYTYKRVGGDANDFHAIKFLKFST